MQPLPTTPIGIRLFAIDDLLRARFGKSLSDFPQFPPLQPVPGAPSASDRLVAKSTNFDPDEQSALFRTNFQKLNADQRRHFTYIREAIDAKRPFKAFMDGPGGT